MEATEFYAVTTEIQYANKIQTLPTERWIREDKVADVRNRHRATALPGSVISHFVVREN